jgi:protein-glutamine gamma-glutamyltransferase
MNAFSIPAFFRRRKHAAPPETLDLALIPWLMATGAVTMAPHFSVLPVWLPITACLAMLWRGWLWKQGRLFANSWLVLGLAGAGTVGILFEYRTIFGREPGVALLVVLMSLKLMELRRPRDAVVVVMLAYFLLLTHYFFADSIPVGLWMLVALVTATAALIRLQAPHAGAAYDTVRHAGILVLQALPIMAVLFLLFPRINGPLWGLPQDSRKASSGLSEVMAPGSISELSLSTALAFRAEFKGPMPARNLLYWRGPVLSDFDGAIWKPDRSINNSVPKIIAWPVEPLTAAGKANPSLFDYTLTLEPHQQRWLLALDLPVKLPANTSLSSSLTVLARNRVRERLRLDFTSMTQSRAGAGESPNVLGRALALPAEINPRSRKLAAGWRSELGQPAAIVESALKYFQQEKFVYTLQPPLVGRDGVDEFLFDSKRGFCEHYASAFVFLMRAAGVPARVVTGYLGGELNPVDGHLSIRQSDAHAWAEVWINGEGWRRIDPTATIAPNRIEQGLQSALPEGEALPALLRPEFDWLRTLRHRWDAIDYAWNRWVLGYDSDRQRQLLSRFGIASNWQTLVAFLAGFMGVAMLALGIWIARQKPRLDRAQALWIIACEAFARRGFPRAAGEGPMDYARRLSTVDPLLAEQANSIADHYVRLRYARSHADNDKFRSELATLYRQVGALVSPWYFWKLWRLRAWTFARR